MWNQTLALLVRSLRAEVRDVRIHLFRLAVVGIVIVVLMTTMAGSVIVGAPGLRYFSLLAKCNFWFITFAGASFFAACITEEREEGTLGLLKMAGLSPISILAGKALPLLIGAALLLSVQYPFTVLAITLGGVTWNQVVGAYVCLLAHLVLVAGISVLISVISQRTAVACGRAAILWVVLMLGSWCVLRLTSAPAPTSPLARSFVQALEAANVWLIENFAYYQIGAVLSIGPASEILSSQVVSNVLLGIAFAAVAALAFNRATANEVESSSTSWWRTLGRRRGTRHRAWRRAIIGKEFVFLTGGRLAFLARALLIPVFAAFLGWASFGFQWWRLMNPGRLADWFFWTGSSLVGIEAAINAARVFRTETAGRTWSSLCMLPRSVATIASYKVLGAMISLLPAILLVVVSFPLTSNDVLPTRFSKLDGEAAFFILLLAQVVLGMHLAASFSISLRWAVWPVALFLATFCEVMAVILFVLILSDVLKYPGPNSCAGTIWTAVVVSIVAMPLLQRRIVRQLERAVAID